MKIIYCKGWSRRRKYTNQIFSKDDTKELYLNRKPFGVVVEKDDTPYCFINFNNKFIYVGFLDELKREYLGYEFSEQETNKIFLKEVQFWEYENDTDTKIHSTRYRFNTEGVFGIETDDLIKKKKERKTAQEKIDISKLYEEYPKFDNYDDIIILEKDILNNISD